jgi:hypothetical protein
MSVWSTIRTWFFENWWPLLQSFLTALVGRTFEWFMEQVNKFLDDSAERLAQKAMEASKEEIKEAESTEDSAEADKHRALANVWKKVAADIKEENLRLKTQLARVFVDQQEEFNARIHELRPDDVFENLATGDVKLKVGGTDLIVPASAFRRKEEHTSAEK